STLPLPVWSALLCSLVMTSNRSRVFRGSTSTAAAVPSDSIVRSVCVRAPRVYRRVTSLGRSVAPLEGVASAIERRTNEPLGPRQKPACGSPSENSGVLPSILAGEGGRSALFVESRRTSPLLRL